MKKVPKKSAQLLVFTSIVAFSFINTALGEQSRGQRIESVEKEIEAFKNILETNRPAPGPRNINILSGTLPGDIKIDFIKVPATTSEEWKTISGGRDYFLMGDNKGDRSPVRFVKLDYDFFIASTEVSQKQWNSLMGNPADTRGYDPNPEVPVNKVDWQKAQRYVNKFSEDYSIGFLNGLKKFFSYRDYVYRLPTEAEWEYASRAGMFEPDEAYLETTSWSRNRSYSREAVGTKKPNPWGIHDMLGNVFEITADCWPSPDDIKFGDQNLVRINPVGSGRQVNARGGAWYSTEHVQSYAWRSSCNHKQYSGDHLGLRLVLAPPLASLNKAGPPRPKPKPRLISDKSKPLQLLSKKDCDSSFDITGLSVLKEYNDHVTMKVCYVNNTENILFLSALTYMNGENTGKWSYQPARATRGRGCGQMSLGKSSLFAYSSDAIELSAGGSRCEAMFEFRKRWTDGNDERKQKASVDTK